QKLERELADARRSQEEARARIRSSAPRALALRDPVPLGLREVRHALEPGTLLLAYSLRADAGRVYAVGPGPDEFAAVALPAAALRDEVRRFRELIQARRGTLL